MKCKKWGQRLLAIAAFLCLPAIGNATTEAPAGGLTIANLGVGDQGFFTTIEAPASARGCIFGQYYVDLSTPGGRSIYATLLTAKTAGKKIARLDWNITGSAQCFVYLVGWQD